MSDLIPDLAEPIVAYRCWAVAKRLGNGSISASVGDLQRNPHLLRLESIFASHAWTTGPQTFSPRGGKLSNVTPIGFHSFKSLEDAVRYSIYGVPFHWRYRVIGEVYQWGRVYEHERGYRSEYAQIKCFIITDQVMEWATNRMSEIFNIELKTNLLPPGPVFGPVKTWDGS